MFTRIVVPLDGSARAERALPVAARIARASGSSIVLLRVINPPVEVDMYMAGVSSLTEDVIDAEIAAATDYLKEKAQSEVLSGIKTKLEVMTGSPAAAILMYVQERSADLIVLSSHGYASFKRWVLGSVADKVTRLSPVPVLTVRDKGPVPEPCLHEKNGGCELRALATVDGSPLSEAVLAPLIELLSALAEKATLHILRVVAEPVATNLRGNISGSLSFTMIEHAKEEAQEHLSSLEKRLEAEVAGKNITITSSLITDVDVAGSIIRTGESPDEGGYELIAMATHGRSGIQHWAMGSITERVLHGTQLPLFVVRPAALIEQEKAEHQKSHAVAVEQPQGWVGLL